MLRAQEVFIDKITAGLILPVTWLYQWYEASANEL